MFESGDDSQETNYENVSVSSCLIIKRFRRWAHPGPSSIFNIHLVWMDVKPPGSHDSKWAHFFSNSKHFTFYVQCYEGPTCKKSTSKIEIGKEIKILNECSVPHRVCLNSNI